MPDSATLMHPIECPLCRQLRGQEIEFLQGYFDEDAQTDLRLGETIDGVKTAAIQKAFASGLRTHGLFLCENCRSSVTCLVAIRRGRAVEVEVFPAAIQKMLSTFPACLYLVNSDDEDMILLSALLQKYGATKVSAAIARLSHEHYSKAYWQKRGQTRQSLSQNTAVREFLNLLQQDDPEVELKAGTPYANVLDRIAALFEEKQVRESMSSGEGTYRAEQRQKHQKLRQALS